MFFILLENYSKKMILSLQKTLILLLVNTSFSLKYTLTYYYTHSLDHIIAHLNAIKIILKGMDQLDHVTKLYIYLFM